MRVLARVLATGALAFPVFFATSARADIQHTVAKGHTIEAIAHRYHVSDKAILEANHLKDGKHLQIGQVLTIPKVEAPAKAEDKRKTEKAKAAPDAKGKDAKEKEKAIAAGFAQKAKTPGVVHVLRVATKESADVRISDDRGKVSGTALHSFEKIMRSPTGAAHPIEPRLLGMLSTVSNHFGSRRIEIVSGFRPFTPTQYTAHSNHNHGKAVDFRIPGVPNEAVRDYCRSLKNVGCGYYPNSVFVHLDVRDASAFWIDYSKPGEAPRYNAPNVDADEGTSDVSDGHAIAPEDPVSPERTETPPESAAPNVGDAL